MTQVIPKLFLENALKHKDRILFHYFDEGWKSLTYGDAAERIKGIASCLISNGITKGERAAIISENRPEWCLAYLGITLAGGVAVPVDAQLGIEEIRNLLEDSGSKAVFLGSKAGQVFEKASSSISIEAIYFDSLKFREMAGTPEQTLPDISQEDTASLIYTSGTTGAPKGVLLSHRNFCSDAEAIMQIGIIAPGDNFIAILPFHHTYPFMANFILPIAAGLTVTFSPSLKGPELISAIKEKGVTILVGVPQLLELIRNGMINKIKQLPRPLPAILVRLMRVCGRARRISGMNPGKLIFGSAHRALGKQFKFFASGGAKLDAEVMQDLEAIGFTVLEGYGLTETAPVVTFNSPSRKRKPGSIGMPLPSVSIRIIDPGTGREAAVTDEGEIVINGPMVMKGYYRNPEATDLVLRDGWFHSGDLGCIDQEGHIFVTGRLKEVIVLSSGKNVYPEDAEKRYQKIPLIKEMCILGLGREGLADSLHAVIVPDLEYARKAGVSNFQEALKWELESASLRLPPFMRIKGYTLHQNPLPRTPLGKLRRFMVKDLITAKGEKPLKREEDQSLAGDEVGRMVVECIYPLLKEKIPVGVSDNLELDLGLDSLARIELVVALERAFSIKLPETFAAGTQTVGELIEQIKGLGITTEGREETPAGWRNILAEPLRDEPEDIIREQTPVQRFLFQLCLNTARIILRVFFRLNAKGLEHIPVQNGYILCPNHVSYLDAFCIAAVLPDAAVRDIYSLGIRTYFSGRFAGAFARLAHVIPIDAKSYLSKALKMSALVLKSGKNLMVFPEGGRSFDGRLMEFKKGVGILAKELGIQVVPAYIQGSYKALPRGKALPRFTQITVIFGKPFKIEDIDFSEKPEEMDDYQYFADILKARVKELQDVE